MAPSPPTRKSVDDWQHFPLYRNIREAIASLPLYFRTETHISGIMATDLHTLNTVLGATIEDQVSTNAESGPQYLGFGGNVFAIQLRQAGTNISRHTLTSGFKR